MAKVKLNPILEGMRGQVGDLVFRRMGDEVVVSRKPDMEGVEPTERQLAARERFRQAVLYGRIALADPQTKALYQSAAEKAGGQPVFSLAVADFFNAPSIDEVDLSGYTGQPGDMIIITARDDFQVASVTVTLTDGAGTALESGPAAENPAGSGRFVYTAQAAVAPGTAMSARVTAADRPGTEATASESKTV